MLENLIKNILSLPKYYKLWQKIVGASKFHKIYISEFIKPYNNCKILDIGCGPGDILEFLPDFVTYIGLDSNQTYIEHALKKYGKKGCFYVSDINDESTQNFKDFDIVMANGVLHHLNDDEALKLFQFAHKSLKPNGILITHDGCYTTNQSLLVKLLLDYDRGKYVRTSEKYLNIANQIFENAVAIHKTNLYHIPYDSNILNCIKTNDK